MYVIDTVDGLGFGKSDPYWKLTIWGARKIAKSLGPRARIRQAWGDWKVIE